MILDPIPALVVIDLQKGIVALPTIHPAGEIVTRAAALAAAFRRRHLPVALVNVAGGAPGRVDQPMTGTLPPDWTELVAELAPAPTDHRVTKKTWGAFTGTDLAAWLHDHGATQIVLAGIATSIGIESTARQAHELGFNVVLATNAMTDRSAEAHDNSTLRIFPRLGERATTGEILAALGE
jgi:nicotinamidase-related amidase